MKGKGGNTGTMGDNKMLTWSSTLLSHLGKLKLGIWVISYYKAHPKHIKI